MTGSAPGIRPCSPDDAAQICAIYNHYVRETVVTFEETPVSDAEMAERIRATVSRLPWLVFEDDRGVVGYAYASPWKSRAAYRNSVEGSIYLAPDATGKGIGPKLYAALIDELKSRGLHSMIGGAAMPNDASVRLHERLGFVKVAEFRQVGFKFGRWVDVAYWQLIL
jgi:L-amino acid N-acyltransferase YncA